MNEHERWPCGCMSKIIACRCDFIPHTPHNILVSGCLAHKQFIGKTVAEAHLSSAEVPHKDAG